MYYVTIANDSTEIKIHNETEANTTQKIVGATIVQQKNAIASFSFTIYPNNDGYEMLNPYTTEVKVYNTLKNRYEFIGRVLQVNPSMGSDGLVSKSVVCEDRFAYLCDTVQPFTPERQYEGDDTRNGLQEFIDVILANHNAQVSAEKNIYRGNVTLTTYESSEGVYKGLNYETTMQIITEKLLNVFGGEMRIRESNGVLYLDYAEELGVTRNTSIDLARNMKSASRVIDSTNIITRLIPLGAKMSVDQTDESGNVTSVQSEERLTIESVTEGGEIYVQDETAYNLYGEIYGVQTWDDVTDAGNLQTKGAQWLVDNNKINTSHTIEAVDLSLLGMDVDDFQVYDKYPVTNSLIGLNDTLEVIKKTININEPQLSSFDMGDRTKNLSDILVDSDYTIADVIQKINQTETGAKNDINEVYSFINTSTTAIKQTETDIIASVESVQETTGSLESFSETVRNILQMEADGTTMLFQTINEAIETVAGTEETHYNEILKYIRFEDGSIILGESNNPLTLTIEHDRIAFKQNGVIVAYFSDNKLYVNDGEFQNTLQIGNFLIYPRDNGNVSCKMIAEQV